MSDKAGNFQGDIHDEEYRRKFFQPLITREDMIADSGREKTQSRTASASGKS